MGLVWWWLTATALVVPAAEPSEPSIQSAAPDVAGDFADVSLDEILNAEVTVASSTARKAWQAPAVVTVITRAEILAVGARDLVDILRLVPGFEPAMDVEGVTGIGFRGVWGHEGKILLLVDGLEQNDISFSTTQLAHHYNPNAIERIEIIRGPGSALYGGYAELAVINVITREVGTWQGASGTASYGHMTETFARRDLSLSVAKVLPLGSGLGLTAHGFFGQGNRSDRRYTSAYGESYDMADASRLDTASLNVALTYDALKVRFLTDRYRVQSRDLFDTAPDRAADIIFTTTMAAVEYEWAPTDLLTITPRFMSKAQTPWHYDGAELLDGAVLYDTRSERHELSVRASYRATDTVQANAGAEATYDRNFLNLETSSERYAAITEVADLVDDNRVSFYNVAAFGEVLADLPWASISAGARADHHNQFGNAFSPRLAMMRSAERWHVKAIFSQAFRAPSLENMALMPDIKPERTTAYELEIGTKLGSAFLVSANLFDMTVRRTIVYGFDVATDTEYYVNAGKSGTSGAELEMRALLGPHSLVVNYAYYTPRAFLFGDNKNETNGYTVPQTVDPTTGDVTIRDDALLGFAAHKLGARVRYQLLDGLAVTASGSLYNRRYGHRRVDAVGNIVTESFPPLVLVNLYADYAPASLPGLSTGLGVYDVVGQRGPKQNVYLQPYEGEHAPLPMGSREVMARLTYELPL